MEHFRIEVGDERQQNQGSRLRSCPVLCQVDTRAKSTTSVLNAMQVVQRTPRFNYLNF